MFIDTHAHIYTEEFKTDIHDVILRAQDAGVEKILMPNIDTQTIDDMMELEVRYPNFCYAMMGLHPCSVKKDFEKQLYEVEDWLSKREFIAVGEMGTDLYWDKTFWDQQKEAFRIQSDLAIKYDLPIVIHCRETIDETIELVEEKEGSLKGVFHCFTGDENQAKKIVDLDFYLGLGGVSTFKNGGLNEVVPNLDTSKIVLETDSPYLSPAPERGKRNEPAKVSIIANKISEYLKKGVDEVASFTTENANSLFFPK